MFSEDAETQNTVRTLRCCELGLHISKIVFGLFQEKKQAIHKGRQVLEYDLKNFWVN